MHGYIKFINSKDQYGVVISTAKEEYKFNFNDFPLLEVNSLKSGITISFDVNGKRAKNCKIVENRNNQFLKEDIKKEPLYIAPKEVYWSSDYSVSGWETLETSNWEISASGRGNPNTVKEDLKNNAKFLGANAIVNIRYFTSEGSEAGTGSGTHYYTIHNYVGHPVNIGKKNVSGISKEKIITDINKTAQEYKEVCSEAYSRSWSIALALIVILAIVSINNYVTSPDKWLIPAIIEFFFLVLILKYPNDKSWWLRKK